MICTFPCFLYNLLCMIKLINLYVGVAPLVDPFFEENTKKEHIYSIIKNVIKMSKKKIKKRRNTFRKREMGDYKFRKQLGIEKI